MLNIVLADMNLSSKLETCMFSCNYCCLLSLPPWLSWLSHDMHQVGQTIPAARGSNPGHDADTMSGAYATRFNFSGRYRKFTIVLLFVNGNYSFH